MSHPIRSLFVASFLLTTVAHAVLSQAAESRLIRIADVHVRFHDLDLREDADAQILLDRVARAAITACGGYPVFHRSYDLLPRRTVEVFERCRDEAVARAVDSVGAPTVSRLFAGAP
jgi:UrcA family protein